MPLTKLNFQKEGIDSHSTSDSASALQEKLPKSAITFLCLINEQMDKLACLAESTEVSTADKTTLNTLLEHLIKLLELPSISCIAEVNKKIERLISEITFKKKNRWKFEQLTGREKEVLCLLAQGYSNNKIAECLYICTGTVKHHRKIIKSKLSAASTADLIKYSLAFNLI